MKTALEKYELLKRADYQGSTVFFCVVIHSPIMHRLWRIARTTNLVRERLVLETYQFDMRRGYINGIPGIAVSGFVWLIAGLASQFHSEFAGAAALFFGGMAIYPLSLLISNQFNGGKPTDSANPLNKLAFESTVLIFVGMFAGYSARAVSPGIFFNIVIMVIGARYLVFQSIYGRKQYWILGAILMVLGFALISPLTVPASMSAYLCGCVELAFAVFMMLTQKPEPDFTVEDTSSPKSH